MRQLTCLEPGLLDYSDVRPPALKKNQAIIRIRRIGICGTDLHAFEGNQPYFTYPRVLGHELSGELVDFDNAPGFSKGEKVTFIPYFSCGQCLPCRTGTPNHCVQIQVCGVHTDGGMAEYISVPSYALVHGGGLDFDQLALVEPLAIGAHAIRRAAVKREEWVLVMGAGPIGLACMEFAQIAGAKVIAMDINPARLRFVSERSKAQQVLDAADPSVLSQLQVFTGGDMPGVVIDATGNLQAIQNGFSYMAHGGRYVLVGLQKQQIAFSHPEFHKREGTLMSSRNALRSDFEQVIDALQQRRIDPLTYITHQVTFDGLQAAFPEWLKTVTGLVKAMVSID